MSNIKSGNNHEKTHQILSKKLITINHNVTFALMLRAISLRLTLLHKEANITIK